VTDQEIRVLARIRAGAPAQDVRLGGLGQEARQLAEAKLAADQQDVSRGEALDRVLASHPEFDGSEIKMAMFRSALDETEAGTPDTGGNGQGFQLLTAQELMSMPPLRWLVDHHLPAGGFAVLYGPPGGGKSFVALDLAMSVATGTDWLGVERVDPGVVVYVAAEGSAGLAKRVGAWINAHG
jgi:hypothetical protein